jgi:hypothetical protein
LFGQIEGIAMSEKLEPIFEFLIIMDGRLIALNAQVNALVEISLKHISVSENKNIIDLRDEYVRLIHVYQEMLVEKRLETYPEFLKKRARKDLFDRSDYNNN